MNKTTLILMTMTAALLALPAASAGPVGDAFGTVDDLPFILIDCYSTTDPAEQAYCGSRAIAIVVGDWVASCAPVDEWYNYETCKAGPGGSGLPITP